mmetsp:Transcript_23438/g.76290  ORF Transcript_23438/g.76290 Transcript_23438/m.76290 type:complete len:343 (-) Transcript_23438:8-1036(-)
MPAKFLLIASVLVVPAQAPPPTIHPDCNVVCVGVPCGTFYDTTCSDQAVKLPSCNCGNCCRPDPPATQAVAAHATPAAQTPVFTTRGPSSVVLWQPPGPGRKAGACAGPTTMQADPIWQAVTIAECQEYCALDIDCVAIEFTEFVPKWQRLNAREYARCTIIDFPSKVTHVLPRPDGARCLVKPTRGLCPPPTRSCPCCWLAGPGVDFKYGSTPCAELQNADLSNMNLEGAKLDGVDMQCAKLDGASLKGASFGGANLKSVSFVGANLDGADFTQADANFARFGGANLKSAKFLEANVERADFKGAVGLRFAEFAGAKGIELATWGPGGVAGRGALPPPPPP